MGFLMSTIEIGVKIRFLCLGAGRGPSLRNVGAFITICGPWCMMMKMIVGV